MKMKARTGGGKGRDLSPRLVQKKTTEGKKPSYELKSKRDDKKTNEYTSKQLCTIIFTLLMGIVLWLAFDDPVDPEHQPQAPRHGEPIIKNNEATETGEPMGDENSRTSLYVIAQGFTEDFEDVRQTSDIPYTAKRSRVFEV